MTTKQREAIEAHGRNLLAIFPRATVRNPVTLCKALRRHEARLHRIAELACDDAAYCSQPEEVREAEIDRIMAKVNALLGNVHEYQPKTGRACSCRPGQARDNCPTCEGTGHVVDFRAIRERAPLVPVIFNRDPRGYALKIDYDWMGAQLTPAAYVAATPITKLRKDFGGYGLIAPEIGKEG